MIPGKMSLLGTGGEWMSSQWQRWSGIMKCYPFEEKRLAKWEPPYIVQPKFDGVRCRAVPVESGYLLLSSEENVIFSVPHINEELKTIKSDFELDGELYCHELSFQEILSITSRTVNLHYEHKIIKLHIFDIINDEPQHSRLAKLLELKRSKLKHIEVASFWMCDTFDEVMRVYDRLIKLDYEGMIVRHKNAPYERKRSTLVMKFKPKKEDVYEILGWKEEISINGHPKNRLGSLICQSGDGTSFSVGSGLNDVLRKDLWKSRENLIGKSAKIQYQHLTSGKKVPRFPIFVSII